MPSLCPAARIAFTTCRTSAAPSSVSKSVMTFIASRYPRRRPAPMVPCHGRHGRICGPERLRALRLAQPVPPDHAQFIGGHGLTPTLIDRDARPPSAPVQVKSNSVGANWLGVERKKLPQR